MSRFILLGLSLVLSVGCVSKRKYDALASDYETLYERHQDLVAKRAALALDRAAMEDRLIALEARNEALAAYYRDLLNDFGPLMESGDVTLLIYPDHTSLAFSEAMTFDENEATLSDAGVEAVQTAADLIRRHPSYTFEVQGHTDAQPIASGPFEDNWRLGAARALTVLDELIDDGVDPDRLSASCYAATEPIAANSTELGRSLNRRVEIALQPGLEDMPMHQELIWEASTASAAMLATGDDSMHASR